MRVRVGTWILSLTLLFAVGCKKPSQSNNTQAPDNSQANNSSPANNSSSAPDNSQPPAPVNITIPAGKVLTIQLADEVGSKISQPGQTFGGSLARPVTVNGEEVIPAGARVRGEVVDAKAMGH